VNVEKLRLFSQVLAQISSKDKTYMNLFTQMAEGINQIALETENTLKPA
jgi:hypothetical protein